VVFYHLIVWLLLPLKQMPRLAPRAKFVAQNVVLVGFLYCFMPATHWFPRLTLGWWTSQNVLWAYFHITVSFAVSGFNPRWVARWFAPRAFAPAVAGIST
jgi:hypothetical protein